MPNKPENINPEEYSILEEYLDGKLTGTELVAFENRLVENLDWKEKLEEVKMLREGIERSAMKSRMVIFHQELTARKAASKSLNTSLLWVAAASLFIFITAGALWSGWFTSDSDKLFEAYYVKDPGLTTLMSNSDSYEFDRGMVAFKTGEYDKSLEYWTPLLEQSPMNDTLQYFVAMDYLQTEDLQAGKVLLELVAEDKNSQFSQDAYWYLGLIAIKEERYQEAKNYLKNSSRAEATSLLKELE